MYVGIQCALLLANLFCIIMRQNLFKNRHFPNSQDKGFTSDVTHQQGIITPTIHLIQTMLCPRDRVCRTINFVFFMKFVGLINFCHTFYTWGKKKRSFTVTSQYWLALICRFNTPQCTRFEIYQSFISALYLGIIWNTDVDGKLWIQLYENWYDFVFSAMYFPCLCSNAQILHTVCIYPLTDSIGRFCVQLCFSNQHRLLTNKVMLPVFQKSCLEATVRAFAYWFSL